MGSDWDQSARAWIAEMGERGDWSREHVLDPAMLGRLAGRRFERALDVGCGEGRFCRLLGAAGIAAIGIDPTAALLEQARRRDPDGDYRLANAERLPFDPGSFDLVVSYLTLIDIPDFRAAIREMARVLAPGGTLLIANLASFVTSAGDRGWVKDEDGRKRHYPIDRYLEEFAFWGEWAGIRIRNWHRPLGAYLSACLDSGLELVFFDEPDARSGDEERRVSHRRVPWFLVMEWRRGARLAP